MCNYSLLNLFNKETYNAIANYIFASACRRNILSMWSLTIIAAGFPWCNPSSLALVAATSSSHFFAEEWCLRWWITSLDDKNRTSILMTYGSYWTLNKFWIIFVYLLFMMYSSQTSYSLARTAVYDLPQISEANSRCDCSVVLLLGPSLFPVKMAQFPSLPFQSPTMKPYLQGQYYVAISDFILSCWPLTPSQYPVLFYQPVPPQPLRGTSGQCSPQILHPLKSSHYRNSFTLLQ